MHIDKSDLRMDEEGYFIEASDLPQDYFPDWFEVIDGDYVVDRFTNPRKNLSGYPDYELLSVDYFSDNGDTLRVIND